jgi:hypothetical protein
VEYAIGDYVVIRAVGWGASRSADASSRSSPSRRTWSRGAPVARGGGATPRIRYLWLGAPLLIFLYRRRDLVPVALAALGLAMGAS